MIALVFLLACCCLYYAAVLDVNHRLPIITQVDGHNWWPRNWPFPRTGRSDWCTNLCRNNAECRANFFRGRTYCEEWKPNPTCYGLRWTSSGNLNNRLCYQPDFVLPPRRQLAAPPTNPPAVQATTAEPANVVANSNPNRCDLRFRIACPNDAYCERLCQNFTDCYEDPHSHGSWCERRANGNFCHGLYSRRRLLGNNLTWQSSTCWNDDGDDSEDTLPDVPGTNTRNTRGCNRNLLEVSC